MLGIGVIAFLLKDSNMKTQKRIEQNEKSIEVNEKCIESLEQKFNDFRADLPKNYVMKDDFIRAMTNVDKKLDKIYDMLASKKGGCE